MTDVVDIFLGDLKCALHRFEPKPGDVFVLTVPGEITDEFAKRLSDTWNDQMQWPAKVAVLPDGMGIKLCAAESIGR